MAKFWFEENYDPQIFIDWIGNNWTLAFWFSGVYVVVIFSLKSYMRNRPRYELRPALALWSAILAVFSIFGAARTVPELASAVYHYGFDYSICTPAYFYGATAFWAFMFTVSKIYELGDTLFIVLRKQRLTFLHWYHHVTVMCYVWYSVPAQTAPCRWFMVMNYTVHAFMYTYYTLKALKFSIPKKVNICITGMQISQMFMGIIVNLRSYDIKRRGGRCQQSYTDLRWSFLMYFSYLLLFLFFFYQNYMVKKKNI